MKEVDLFRDENKTMTFNFADNIPYFQYFEIKGMEKKEKSYSYSNTFWLTFFIMGVVNLMGLFLDNFLTINPIMGAFTSITSSIFFIKLMLDFLKKKIVYNKKEYKVTKQDIYLVLQQGVKKYWMLWLTNVFLMLGLLLTTIISISSNRMSGKDFIMTSLLVSVVTFIQGTIQPNRVIKARKILKNQLEEGRFE